MDSLQILNTELWDFWQNKNGKEDNMEMEGPFIVV